MSGPRPAGRGSLTCLGIGDGWASEGRHHSAFVHRLGETALLVDCGEPVGRNLKAHGFGPDDLAAILLSHLHFDHLGGLFMLLQGYWLEPRRRPLTVYLPREGIEPIRTLLSAGYIFPDLLEFGLRLEPLSDRVPISVGEARITPVRNSHLESLRRRFQAIHPHPFDSFSFLLDAPAGRVAHTADLGALADLEPLLQSPVELLVCELGHLEPTEVFARLGAARAERIVFHHLSRAQWAQREALAAQAARELPGRNVRLAREGEVIEW